MQTETMNVTGMTCGGCVGKVTQALTAVPGVGHVDVSLPGKASVDFDEKLTSRERLQWAGSVISRTGTARHLPLAKLSPRWKIWYLRCVRFAYISPCGEWPLPIFAGDRSGSGADAGVFG